MKKDTSYKILDVNIMFFLLGIVFLTFGAYVQSQNFDTGIIITEYIIILLPVIIYGLYKKIDLLEALRLKKISFKVVLKIIGLSIFLVPIIGFGNIVITTILSYFDLVIYFEMPSAQNGYELLKYSFLMAISAGICEEIFFRGMILNAYEKHTNRKFALIISSILFGVMHYNIQNLIGPMLLGVIFAYLVYITDSIFSSIIAHTLNNGVSVFVGYLMNKYNDGYNTLTESNLELTSSELLLTCFFIALIAIISVIIIYIFIKSIKKDCFKVRDNMSVTIDNQNYFVVKKKREGLILIKENLNFYSLSVNDIYERLNFYDNKKLENITIEENLNMTKNKIDIELYKFFPILLSLIMYGYYMFAVWKNFGLI